jgi:hypothetical protein
MSASRPVFRLLSIVIASTVSEELFAIHHGV